MKVYRKLEEIEEAPEGRAIAVGMFDGVHIGHRALLRRLMEVAAAEGLRGCVLTFDQHPLRTLRPDVCPALITDWRRKVQIIEQIGLHEAAVIPFSREFASTMAEEFIRRILAERLNVRAVLCGADFRFGRGAQGSVQDLRAIGEPLGIRTEVVELVRDNGFGASSTKIRDVIRRGDIALANRLLGEPFVLSGIVSQGDHRGTELGFPTANLAVAEELVVPDEGVYACRAQTQDGEWGAAVSIGDRPTFGGDQVVIEAHLIDYTGGVLYDSPLALTFVQRMRGQIRYDDPADLICRMDEDVRAVREALAKPSMGRVI